MPQFDVHRNRNASRSGTPFLLIVQSKRFDSSGRRVVVPLLPTAKVAIAEPAFAPVFLVEQQPVILNLLQIASVPADHLGDFICSLSDDSDRIIAAIDFLISRAWG